MNSLLENATEVQEHIPSTEDLNDYHRWSAQVDRSWWEQEVEARDRRETMESLRRQAWNRAEFAVAHIEGVAAGLSANGLDEAARTLLAACGNINDVLRQYA